LRRGIEEVWFAWVIGGKGKLDSDDRNRGNGGYNNYGSRHRNGQQSAQVLKAWAVSRE
jgi:hypothetical protein